MRGDGRDKKNQGKEKSSKLRDQVNAWLFDWIGTYGGLGLSFAPFDNSAPDKHGPKLKTYDFLTRVDDQAAAIAFLASRRAGTALRAGIFNDINRLGPFS